jgi:hypothetical protein
MSMAGAAVSASGAKSQANAQAAQMEYNAKVSDINAKTARAEGLYEADRIDDKYDKVQGEITTAAAKGGVLPNTGSAALLKFDDTLKNSILDQQTAIWNKETEAVGHENKATDLRAQAQATRSAGKTAAAGAIFGGLAGAVKGFGGGSGGGAGSPLLIG